MRVEDLEMNEVKKKTELKEEAAEVVKGAGKDTDGYTNDETMNAPARIEP